MNVLPAERFVEDIGACVQKQIDVNRNSYLTYARLVEESRGLGISPDYTLRSMCPIVDVRQMLAELNASKNNIYSTLDDTAYALFQDYGERLQLSKEKSLLDKNFDRQALEIGYSRAQERPYRLAKFLSFGGSATASALMFNSALSYSTSVSAGGLALFGGVIVGSAFFILEVTASPLGKILSPFEKIMMLDYAFKDMDGTSIHEEKLRKQCIKKISQYEKASEYKMRA